jgi:hypothetical protein
MNNKRIDPEKYGMVICPSCNSHGYTQTPKRRGCLKCGGFGFIHLKHPENPLGEGKGEMEKLMDTTGSFKVLIIELISQTKNTLDSIKKIIELSRGKFSDEKFGEVFYRMITKDIEKNDLVLNSVLDYVRATTPVRKKGTVNTLMAEVLRKHQVWLEEKRAKIFRNFERDLPEAIIPDEQLRFILESVFQYAMALMPVDGSLESLTKSSALQKEMREDQAFFKKNGNFIEVLVAFTYSKEPKEQATSQKEVVPDLVLRLVDDIIERNQGMIKFELDETKGKRVISLKFPVERRRLVHYD